MDLAMAEMMNHYQLPHAGSSGSGVGWGADLITSGHQWMNHLVSCCGMVKLLKECQPPDDYDDILARGEAFISSL